MKAIFKSRLKIVLAALFAFVATAAITAGIIWAAKVQNSTSTTPIYYEAHQVSATVSANKHFVAPTQADPDVLENKATAFTGGTAGVITFAPEDATTTGTLTSTAEELTFENQYIIYEFVITNTASAGGNSMQAVMSLTGITNITTYVRTSETALTFGAITDAEDPEYDIDMLAAFDTTGWTTGAAISEEVSAQETLYAYVCLKVSDVTKDVASAASKADPAITWVLTDKRTFDAA